MKQLAILPMSLSKKQKFLLGTFWVLFLILFFMRGGKAFADCGVAYTDNGYHYSGAIIDAVWIPYGTSEQRQANNVNINVRSDSGKAVIRQNGSGAAVASADFRQFAHNCRFTHSGEGRNGQLYGDGTGVVLGKGNTSLRHSDGSNSWALNCLRSEHPTYDETFHGIGVGTPSGAREGGTWEEVYFNAVNGSMNYDYVFLTVYREPAPTGGGGGPGGGPTDNGPVIGDVYPAPDCNTIEGWALDTDNPPHNLEVRVYIDGAHHASMSAGMQYTNRGNGQGDIDFMNYYGYDPPLSDPTVRYQFAFPASLKDDITHRIEVYAMNISSDGSQTGGATKLNPSGNQVFYVSCPPPDNHDPTFSLNANCDTIRIRSLSDADHGGTMDIVTYIDGQQVDSRRTRGDFDIAYPTSYKEDGRSHNVRVVARSIRANGSNNPSSSRSTEHDTDVAACYRASCTISDPTSSSQVNVNQAVPVTARLTNIGYYGWNNRVTSRLVYNSSNYSGGGNLSTPVGSTTPNITYNGATTPNSLAQQTMTVEARLDNGALIGSCSVSFDPYVDFVVTPQPGADPTGLFQAAVPDEERPDNYKSSTAVRVDFGNGSVSNTPANVSSGSLTMSYRVEESKYLGNGVWTTGPDIRTTNGNASNGGASNTTFPADDSLKTTMQIPTYNNYSIGDRYCGIASMTNSRGRINRHGNVIDASTPIPRVDDGCRVVIARPIFRVYGGDISAGFDQCQGWTTSKNDQAGDIISWLKSALPDDRGAGAGTQLAILSKGEVRDFASGIGKPLDSSNGPPDTLRFSTVPTYGQGSCPHDYWAGVSGDTLSTSDLATLPVTDPAAEETYQIKPTTAFEVRTSTGMSGRRTVYVDGDVYISGDITLNQGGWSFTAGNISVPSFTLVARGNIYIDNDVHNLDGMYIAQPFQDANGIWQKGEIRTCVIDASGASPDDVSYYEACRSNLTVTGGFMANVVRMQRTLGTRYDSYNTDTARIAAGLDPAPVGQKNANTGEVFVFSPEVWLRAAALNRNDSTKKFDAITSGAPVL